VDTLVLFGTDLKSCSQDMVLLTRGFPSSEHQVEQDLQRPSPGDLHKTTVGIDIADRNLWRPNRTLALIQEPALVA